MLNPRIGGRASFAGLLIVLAGIPSHARGDVAEQACELAYKKLKSGPHERLERSSGSFEHDGASFRGCTVHLWGNIDLATPQQDAEKLFGDPPTYCTDGQVGVAWCIEDQADGPDGTSYRAIRKDGFCLVEGRWDGGDDSDPTYVPSRKYEVTVRCANRSKSTR